MKNKLLFIILLSLFLILISINGTVSAANLTVNPGDSIQSVINNASSNDTIIVNDNNGSVYTYTENVVINKTIQLKSNDGGNVTIQALNSSQPVFTVDNCCDSVIYGFTITGATSSSAIYLNGAHNCCILNNIITGNGLKSTGDFGYGIFMNYTTNCMITGNILHGNEGGIDLEYSNNTLLSENSVTDSVLRGIYMYQANSTAISKNNLANNDGGILACYSNSIVITGNDVKNNIYQGIYLYYSSGDLYFNRIVGNGEYGLLSRGGTVNATNNWWGTNNPRVSSVKPSAIYVINGNVLYNPRLVLTVTPTSYKVSDGKVYEADITADLNHNSNNEDVSTVLYTPDGIPVNFDSDSGSTITSKGYTRNGKASAILMLNPNLESGMANVTATVDNQSTPAPVDRIAKAVITIAGTAIDVSTNQTLYSTYEVPLNESVRWVSVLWKNTGMFHEEVDLVVNGNVVLNKTVSNLNYLQYKNNFSQNVFDNINFLNWLFSNTPCAIFELDNIIARNPQLENLTGNELEEGMLALAKQVNNFTDSEIDFIRNRQDFKDRMVMHIVYPGDAAKTITINDQDSNETLDLYFPGNPIVRVSDIIYADGLYTYQTELDQNNVTHYTAEPAGYEGVRSFAIATTKVTDGILQYWLDQKDRTNVNGTLLYPEGPMKAAYGTFLNALLVIKCHDMVADQAAAKLNVTWSRTSPIAVSVCDDAYECYMTLECDHSFGMTVTGDPGNVWAFRFACSSAINPIEYLVMKTLFPVANSSGNNSSFEDSVYLEHLYSSITLGLGQMILNGEMPDILMSDSYLIMCRDGKFLVLDHETGILRDAMIIDLEFMNSAYCFSDLQTEWAFDLGEELDSINPDTWPEQLQSINNVTIALSSIAAVLGNVVYEGSAIASAEFLGPIILIIAPLAFLDAIQPYAIQEAEQNGDFNLADYLKNNNLMDQVWDILTSHGPPQGVWDESYGYSNPNVQRNLEDIKNLKEGALSIWNEISGFAISHPDQLFDKRHNPMSESYWENYFREQNIKSMRNAEQQITESILNVVGGDKYDEVGQVIDALARDAGKRIASGVSKYQVGNIASGTLDVAVALVEIHWALLLKIAYP